MKFTRWTVALYMALVFACGAVVGAFAYRLYTVSEVSANAGQRNPEEYRKRFMAELKARLNLNDDQAAKLGVIMDQTRQQFRAARATIEPEIQKIREEQHQKISEILSKDQQVEFQKMIDQRRRMRESKKDSVVPLPQRQ
jgi:predicted  nucleic acid-binding Zn-ribbon protein